MTTARFVYLLAATGHYPSLPLAFAAQGYFKTVDVSVAAPAAKVREQLLDRGMFNDFLTTHGSDHVDIEPWTPAPVTDSPDAEIMWAASHEDLRVDSSILKAEKRTVCLRHRLNFSPFVLKSKIEQAAYELQDGSLVFDELSRTRGGPLHDFARETMCCDVLTYAMRLAVPFLRKILTIQRVRVVPSDQSSCKIDGWVTLDMSKASALAPRGFLESNVVCYNLLWKSCVNQAILL